MSVSGELVEGMFHPAMVGRVSCFMIIDPRLRTFVQRSAMQLYEPSTRHGAAWRFPGPMPVTIDRKSHSRLRADYMVTPKADGTRVLMLCLRYFIDGEQQKICALLHRDGTCHLIVLHTTGGFYEDGGSLFDGELVQLTDGTTNLFLFDCYAHRGATLAASALEARLAHVDALVRDTEPAAERLRLHAKAYTEFDAHALPEATGWLRGEHELPFRTDGVVFVHKSRLGRGYEQYKMKRDHTVDLVVVEDEDCLCLASADDNDDTWVVKQELRQPPAWVLPNTVVECSVHVCDDYACFTPLHARPDKPVPNSEYVVEKTVQTIRDNISLESLLRRPRLR